MYWVLADVVIAGCGAEGNVAVPRQEFCSGRCSVGSSLDFRPHDTIGIIKSSAAQ